MYSQKGFLSKPDNTADFNDFIRKAFGPAKAQDKTLQDKLEELSAQDLDTVMSAARYVKLGTSFQTTDTSYQRMVDMMYPRLSPALRKLIADMLQQADPLPPVSDTSAQQLNEAIDAVYRDYDVLFQNSVSPQPVAKQDAFLDKLAMSESSGDTQAEITIQYGRRFVGKYQFGEARLADYMDATNERFSQDEFQQDPALQEKVAKWHLADIDEAVEALGDAALVYSRDGLRAVAHLGGKAGMKKFVQSKGEYNPSDELGTSLQEYYERFGGWELVISINYT